MSTDHTTASDQPAGYSPPQITVLGTLAELTQGGTYPGFDGDGGTANTGSFPPS